MYCRKCSKPDGLSSYKEAGRRDPRSVPGGRGRALSLQMTGSGSGSAARKGLDWMLKNNKTLELEGERNTSSSLYQHYSGVQATIETQRGCMGLGLQQGFPRRRSGAQKPDGSFSQQQRYGGLVNATGGKVQVIYLPVPGHIDAGRFITANCRDGRRDQIPDWIHQPCSF